MKTLSQLEVRCCCDPTKVLGYLAHPQLQALGDTFRWCYLTRARAEQEPWGFPAGDPVRHELVLTVERVTAGAHTFLAIKNRDYPLEDLQRIPGFRASP